MGWFLLAVVAAAAGVCWRARRDHRAAVAAFEQAETERLRARGQELRAAAEARRAEREAAEFLDLAHERMCARQRAPRIEPIRRRLS